MNYAMSASGHPETSWDGVGACEPRELGLGVDPFEIVAGDHLDLSCGIDADADLLQQLGVRCARRAS